MFVVIADLAWSTAEGTTGPWFTPAVSGQVYGSTLMAATFLVVALAAITSFQAAWAAREARALDLRIAVLKGSGVGGTSTAGGLDIDRDIEDTLDEILGATDTDGGSAVVSLDREAHDSLLSITAEGHGVRQEVLIKELSRARLGIHKAATRLWASVAGPIGMGLVFVGIAGAMLPGSDGFLTAHFMLNTALVMFLGYSLPFLMGWAVVALMLGRAYEGKKA